MINMVPARRTQDRNGSTESGGRFKWAALVQLAQIFGAVVSTISVVLLAWIAYLGGKVTAGQAEVNNTLTAVRDTISIVKKDVNNAKSQVDSFLGVERDYNAVLQAQLRKLGHEPHPPQPKQTPRGLPGSTGVDTVEVKALVPVPNGKVK